MSNQSKQQESRKRRQQIGRLLKMPEPVLYSTLVLSWLSLVPRQHSTGGKPRLLGISKRGDVYLRKLLIHVAREALRWADRKQVRRSRWDSELANRRGQNIAALALANKTVRTA